MSIQEIKNIADKVRVMKDGNDFAVNLVETIKKASLEYLEGTRIELENYEKYKHEPMPIDMIKHFSEYSGSVSRKDDGSYVIRVSPFDYPLRKNFTTAHELGHILLRHKFPEDNNTIADLTENIIGRADSTYGKDSSYESEANNFAAELLMPEILIKKKFLDDKKNESLEHIGKIAKDNFEVSRAAMLVRLDYLKYKF